jgi:hypothetical protein
MTRDAAVDVSFHPYPRTGIWVPLKITADDITEPR